MAGGAEDPPGIVPVFAVSGALLLPGARLPLSVFEPRYLALVDDVLGEGRLFALVQPRSDDGGGTAGLFGTGCLARIVAFGETGDGRYLITALGLRRFRVAGEAEGRSGYRRVLADYTPYGKDLEPETETGIDRHRLIHSVGAYLGRQGVKIDLAKLEKATDGEVVTALAMAAPLSPEEKQALLESPSIAARAQLMIALFEMALLTEDGGNMALH